MTYIGAIELSIEEIALLREITLDVDPRDQNAMESNQSVVPKLMNLLLSRGAIPSHRLAYFNEPEYRSGRLKGSHRSLFEKNGTAGAEIYEHYSFLKYLRYFVLGADLPEPAIREFRGQVERLEPITSDDVQDLWEIAKAIVKKHQLQPHDKAEEFFKLCLDCGVFLTHANHVKDAVSKMRLNFGR